MADSAQDKHLPPTARRLKQARDEGQVARSRDLAHFAAVAAGLGLLMAAAPQATVWLRDLLAGGMRFDVRTVATPAAMLDRFAALMVPALLLSGALGLAMLGVAVAAALLSGGWVFTLKPVQPNFGKLNPLAGLGRLFSKAQLGEMLKAVLLALLLGVVGAAYLWNHMEDFALTQSMGLPGAFAAASDRIVGGLWLLVLMLALFAAVDVPLQRFLHTSRLKMSVQEVKEEMKQQEGSPEVKGRIRQRMREVARRRMLAAVPSADLVVMNPTHYAVALKYDDGRDGAPRIVAKGLDLLALKIRDIAREAKVPVLEAPPLARALYAHGELDREIPFALYSAVAQVLAYVFQLRAAMSGRGPWPTGLPDITVPPELDPHHTASPTRAEQA